MANKTVSVKIKLDGAQEAAKEAKKVGDSIARAEQSISKNGEAAAQGLSAIGMVVGTVNASVGSAIQTIASFAGSFKGLAKACMAFISTPIGMAIAAISLAAGAVAAAFGKAKKEAADFQEKLAFSREMNIASVNRELASTYESLGKSIEDAADKLQHFKEIASIRTSAKRQIEDAQSALEKVRRVDNATNAHSAQRSGAELEMRDQLREIKRQREDAQREANEVYGDAEFDQYFKALKLAERKKADASYLVQIREEEVREKELLSKGLRPNGRKFGLFQGPDDQARKAAAREAEKARADGGSALNQAKKAEADAIAEVEKIEREHIQALQKRRALLESLTVLDKKEAVVKEEYASKIASLNRARDEEMASLERELEQRKASSQAADRDWADELDYSRAKSKKMKLQMAVGNYALATDREAVARGVADELDAVYKDRAKWESMSTVEQQENRRKRAESVADAERYRGQRRRYAQDAIGLGDSLIEDAAGRAAQMNALGRGNTSNRLTALGLYGGAISAPKWGEDTAKNTKDLVESVRSMEKKMYQMDPSARYAE